MVVTDVSTASAAVIFRVKSGVTVRFAYIYLVRYVMGGLLLCKVGVLLLVTCYVKYARMCVGISC